MIDRLKDKKMVVLCGSGGVGKTSISAAVAAHFANQGRKVCLITIDPAQRLAAAMGLRKLSGKPKNLGSVLRQEFPEAKGELDAMMFDPNHAFQAFLQSVGDKKIEKEFADSFLFQTLFDEFSGIHEYLALETLYQLEESGQYEMIVLDTPPARNALAFLESPERIAKFFDDRIFRLFLKDPQNQGFFEKIRARTTQTTFKLLELLTGSGPIGEIVRLAPNIKKIKSAFLAHQESIKNIITGDDCSAVFVLGALDIPVYEVCSFIDEADSIGLTTDMFLINRSLQRFLLPKSDLPEADKNMKRLHALATQEQKNLSNLQQKIPRDLEAVFLPELEQPIYDIVGIKQLTDCL